MVGVLSSAPNISWLDLVASSHNEWGGAVQQVRAPPTPVDGICNTHWPLLDSSIVEGIAYNVPSKGRDRYTIPFYKTVSCSGR